MTLACQIQAQDKYFITSANRPLTIVKSGKKHTTNIDDLKAHPVVLASSDSIYSEFGEVNLYVIGPLPPGPGNIDLPAKVALNIYDAVRSSHFRAAEQENDHIILNRAIKYFIGHDEQEHKAKPKHQIGGTQLSFFQLPELNRPVNRVDLQELATISESLIKSDVKDSTVFYLRYAAYYEEKGYYQMAYTNYQLAYNYNQDVIEAAIVGDVYGNFLNRMGLSSYANELKGYNYWTANQPSLAILPFNANDPTSQRLVSNIQTSLNQYLTNKISVNTLEAKTVEKINAELTRLGDQTSSYSKIVAERDDLNVNYLVTGSLSVEPSNMGFHNKHLFNFLSTAGSFASNDSLKGRKILFKLNILNAKTGMIVFNKPYQISRDDYNLTISKSALTALITKLDSGVKFDLNSVFPPNIIGINHVDKDGIPDMVVVNSGQDLFTTADKHFNSIDSFFKAKTTYNVYGVEDLYINGGMYKQRKLVGKLTLKYVGGNISVWSVSMGGKVIKEYLDKKTPLTIAPL